jgi:hypothetical protein
MVTVWENGRLLHDQRLDDIRTRAGAEGDASARCRGRIPLQRSGF